MKRGGGFELCIAGSYGYNFKSRFSTLRQFQNMTTKAAQQGHIFLKDDFIVVLTYNLRFCKTEKKSEVDGFKI